MNSWGALVHNHRHYYQAGSVSRDEAIQYMRERRDEGAEPTEWLWIPYGVGKAYLLEDLERATRSASG